MEGDDAPDDHTSEQSFAPSQIVQNLLLGQFANAFWFSVVGSRDNLSDLLAQIILHSQPAIWIPTELCQSYVDIQWTAASLFGCVTGTRAEIPQEFYMHLLEKDMRDFATNCYATFSLPQSFSIPATVSQRFLGSLRTFKTIDSALFMALLPTIESVLFRISPQILFQELGIDLFDYLSKIDTKTIQYCPVSDIDQDRLPSFLNSLVLLQDSEVIKTLQSVLCMQNEYPKPASLFCEGNLLSMVNTSLYREKNFVDFLFSQVRLILARPMTLGTETTTEKIMETVISVMSLAIDILPFFVVKFHNLFGQFDSKFRTLVMESEYTKRFPMVRELLERFDKDEELIRKLISVTGDKISPTDLLENSIPKLLEDYIHQQVCIDLTKEKCYVISDTDMSKDRNFAQFYRLLRKLVKSAAKRTDISTLFQGLEINDIVVDVFSLLFLRDRNGSFVFSVDDAIQILNAIKGHGNDQFVIPALRKANYAARKGDTDLLSILKPSGILFSEAISSQQFDCAKELAGDNLALKEFCGIAEEVHNSLTNTNTSLSPKSKAELLLSLADFLLVNLDGIPEPVSGLILRHKKEVDPLIVCNGEYLEKVAAESLVPGFYSDNHDEEYANLPFFQAFLDYVRTYFAAMEDNVVPSSVTPESFVQMIVNNANAETWKELEKSKLPIEMILQYSSALDIQTHLFNLIVQKSKPTAYAIFYQKILGGKCDKDEILAELEKARYGQGIRRKISLGQMELIGAQIKPTSFIPDEGPSQPVFEKYLGWKLEQNFSGDEYFELYDMTDEEFAETLISALDSEKFDSEFVNDMFFAKPELYRSIVDSRINSLTVCQLSRIWPYMGFKSIDILVRNGITSITYPGVFHELVQRKEFNGYYQLMHEFNVENTGIEFLKERIGVDEGVIEDVRVSCQPLLEELEISLQRKFPTKFDAPVSKVDEICSVPSEFEKRIVESVTIRQLDNVIRNILKSNTPLCLELVESVLSRCVELLGRVKFTDIDIEMKLSCEICFLSHTLSSFLEKVVLSNVQDVNISLFHKIATIASFTRRFWFSRFGVEVSLANFLTQETASEFAFLCLKYDSFQLMVEFIAIWSLEEPYYLTQRALNPFKMSLFDDGVALVDALVNCEHRQSALFNDCVEDLTVTLSTVQWFDVRSSLDLHPNIENLPMGISLYHRVKDIYENGASVLVGSEQISSLALSLKLLKRKKRLISFYAQNGSFPDAFDILREVREETKRKDYFISSIVAISLFYSNWNSLWRYFEQKELKRMSEYLDHLFETLRRLRMGKVMYDIQMRLHMYEEAIDSALFSMTNVIRTWEKSMKMVDAVKTAVESEIKESDASFILKPRKYSMEDLLILESRISLQKRLITFCMKTEVPYKRELDILSTNEYNEAVAVWMLENMECTYVLDLVQYAPFDLPSACKLLVERLTEGNKLLAYVHALSDCDQAERSVITSMILEALKDKREILEKVISEVNDTRLQAKMWLKYDFLAHAFEAARKCSDVFTIRHILQKAEEQNESDLVRKCKKHLK